MKISSTLPVPEIAKRNLMSKKNRDLALPTAVELKRREVKFPAYKGLLNEIRFDGRTCTFHLPTVELDDRANAVMRNLLHSRHLFTRETAELCGFDGPLDQQSRGRVNSCHSGTDEEVAICLSNISG